MQPSAVGFFDTEQPFASSDFGLDRRLLKACARCSYVYPTRLQSAALRPSLAGSDCVIEGATGSGKTAAYCLALLQRLLAQKLGGVGGVASGSVAGVCKPGGVILVPTRELVDQTLAVLQSLTYYCADIITVAALGSAKHTDASAHMLDRADILVATPAKLVPHVTAAGATAASGSRKGRVVPVDLSALQMLVLDEADLILSYGYEADVNALMPHLPRAGVQTLLLSATISPALASLQRLVMHEPVSVRVANEGADGSGSGVITQFAVRVGTTVDRYLLLYSLLKLALISGKSLVFVNSVDAAFKLKLFLERFSISSAVLNSELPANSRAHILSSFNRGVFDILIATDEAVDDADVEAPPQDAPAAEEATEEAEDEEAEEAEEAEEEAIASRGGVVGQKRKRAGADVEEAAGGRSSASARAASAAGAATADSEPSSRRQKRGVAAASKAAGGEEGEEDAFGVARGVDFRAVSTVINFDVPRSAAAYTHRIGRTARGGTSGVALTFFPPATVSASADALMSKLSAEGGSLQALPFDVAEVEGFRYRVEDMLRSITKAQIVSARRAELRAELLASEALKSHFEDNPTDSRLLLAHDSHLAPRAIKPHLAHVPDYLLPASLRAAVEAAGGGVKTRRSGKAAKKKRAAAQQRGGKAGAGAEGESAPTMEGLIASGGRISASAMVAAGESEAYSARRNNVDPLKALAASSRATSAAVRAPKRARR